MTTPRQPPAGPLEALPGEAGGADARSTEAEERRCVDCERPLAQSDMDPDPHRRCWRNFRFAWPVTQLSTAAEIGCLGAALHLWKARAGAAESRGAKAGLLKAAKIARGVYLENLDSKNGVREEIALQIERHAQRPPGSPSVPAAQQKDQANQGAPTREAPGPLYLALDELESTLRGLGVSAVNGDYNAERMAERLTEEANKAERLLDAIDASSEPRAAPTPALPREAPEPGGTLAELIPRLLAVLKCETCDPDHPGHMYVVTGYRPPPYDEDIEELAPCADCADHPEKAALRMLLSAVQPRAAPSDAAPATPGPSPEDTQKNTLRAATPGTSNPEER